MASLRHGDTTQRNSPARVDAIDLLRQGIDPGGGGGGLAKRLRHADEEALMEVPSGKKFHEMDDFAAVPDAGEA